MESVNTEKSLPFRIFALLSFLPQKMFMLREGLHKKVSLPRSCTLVAQKLTRVSSHDTCTRNPGGTQKTEDNQSMGILTKIFELRFQPFQKLEKFIRFPWVNQDKFQQENDNEKAEVSEQKGIIANILALGSRPMQLCMKMIQTLNPFDKFQLENGQIQEGNGGASITERSKEMESVNTEKSLPFRIFALLSFLPQKMFMLQEKVLLNNDNEKAEVSEHKGIIANILALGSRPMQLCKKMIQTLNPFESGKEEDSQPKGIIAMISEVIQPWKKIVQTIKDPNKLEKENDKLRNELGNLQEKMKELQKENDDITLDAGTAHPNLCIAGDKKSLKHEAQPQNILPNPERFDSTVCVLGSEGFSSGKHYWEVDVGSSTDWDLGVAIKSIERKGKLSLSPKEGFWALGQSGRDYWAKTVPWTRVMMQKKPKKIGVYLSYQDRQVTFFSVTDMSVLFTFNDCSFSGEVYPFFKNSHKETTMRISSIKEEE
ncbi:E3 ubiquitin-protein ligase TRIM58-like isoform X2 [Trachemys scripta elegans]|uniref:E3 ubiquitin-protein ligase TRIM58-like isoform X2 n=1 Tax=Trachemys scripta elegans TaxID=31138 RepID=UPI0015526337|nr:E3 ubiquitin-protein ligase TRIM58-like isoform X2 [Trachemys scripta elegans]